MKIKCIDIDTPRSDGRPGKAKGITVGQEYVVAEVLDTQYSIINNDMKIARYSKIRFEVVDNSEVPSLRANFNTLTTPLRRRIKELEKMVKKQNTLTRINELEKEIAELKSSL